MNRLDGKVAVVTGGTGGMGRAISAALVAAGADVAVTDIDLGAVDEMSGRLGQRAIFLQHDVTSEESWRYVLKETASAFGRINVLVNNAGIAHHSSIEECSVDYYGRIVAVNQIGPFLGMKCVIPHMREAGGGSIVNISSIAGLVGTAGQIGYSDTKFAVRGMTKVAAVELGPIGIRVNSVHPGMTATPQLLDSPDYDKFAKLARKTPLGRIGEPREIADMVVFLASDESSFSTGAEFVADGGVTAL